MKSNVKTKKIKNNSYLIKKNSLYKNYHYVFLNKIEFMSTNAHKLEFYGYKYWKKIINILKSWVHYEYK